MCTDFCMFVCFVSRAVSFKAKTPSPVWFPMLYIFHRWGRSWQQQINEEKFSSSGPRPYSLTSTHKYLWKDSKGRAHSGNGHGIQILAHSLAHWKWCDASDRNKVGGDRSPLWGPGKYRHEENTGKSLPKLHSKCKAEWAIFCYSQLRVWHGWLAELGRVCFGKTPCGTWVRIAGAYCSNYIAVSVLRGLYHLNNTV